MLKAGRPKETSTSTSTSDASTPNSEAERRRASTRESPQGLDHDEETVWAVDDAGSTADAFGICVGISSKGAQ